MITDGAYDLIAEQTNLNAQHVLLNRGISGKSRLKRWKDTHKTEVKKFLANVMYMGLVKYLSIELYWSRDFFDKNSFVPQIMNCNRFQLLLRFMHFSENRSPNKDNRVLKVGKSLELLEKNFTKCKKSGETITIDETIVPCRVRLLFRQYNSGKNTSIVSKYISCVI